VLVTGTTGFLGKNVFAKLSKDFILSTYDRSRLDLLDTVAVRDLLERQKYDVVVHFANPTGHNPIDAPDELFKKSLKVFTNLASCSDLYGKMIYIGSGAEYGKQRNLSQISEEEFGEVLPTDEYGLSRYIMSEIASGKENIYNLRLFGCCGLRDASHKVIPHTIDRIKENKEIVLRENKKLDYLFVEDLVEVLSYFIENKPMHKAYNICSGETWLISEVVEEVKRLMHSNIPVVFDSEMEGLEYSGSNTRIREEIPFWKPTKLKDAIKKIVLNDY
jgi:GDP-L-fucose synthase